MRLGPRSFVLCEQSLPLIDKIVVVAEALSALERRRARICRRSCALAHPQAANPRRRPVLDPRGAGGT